MVSLSGDEETGPLAATLWRNNVGKKVNNNVKLTNLSSNLRVRRQIGQKEVGVWGVCGGCDLLGGRSML